MIECRKDIKPKKKKTLLELFALLEANREHENILTQLQITNGSCTSGMLVCSTLKNSLWKAGLESQLMSLTSTWERQWSSSREKPPTDWSLWRRTKSVCSASCQWSRSYSQVLTAVQRHKHVHFTCQKVLIKQYCQEIGGLCLHFSIMQQ